MRATILLSALIAASPALLAVPSASAEIKPLPKPSQITSGASASSGRSVIAPLHKPVVQVRVRPARSSTPARRASPAAARRRAPARPQRRVLTLARNHGGRRVAPAQSHGGRRPAPPLAVLSAGPEPTPLGLVGFGEVLPSSSRPWPPWALVLLGSLAAGELFLLVQLVRPRPFHAV